MKAHAVKWKSNRWIPIMLASGLLVAVFVVSMGIRIGDQASLMLLHLVPVTLAAWFFGRIIGIVAALASTVSSLLPESATTVLSAGIVPHRVIADGIIALIVFLSAAFWLTRVKSALSEESRLARTDFTTGAMNRRHFHQMAEMEIKRFNRYRRTFTVALLDLDNFKFVNDTWGHAAGDRALRLVSRTLEENLRGTDTVARIGGDEFALLLPETDAEDARTVFFHTRQRLRQAMRESRLPVTFSIGMITFRTAPETVSDMLHRVDSLMYHAKRNGKDRIESRVLAA